MKPHFLIRTLIKIAALLLYIPLLVLSDTGKVFHITAGSAVCVLTAAGLILDRNGFGELKSRYRNYTISSADSLLLCTEWLIAIMTLLLFLSGLLLSAERQQGSTALFMLHTMLALLMPLVMAVRMAVQAAAWLRGRRKKNSADQSKK